MKPLAEQKEETQAVEEVKPIVAEEAELAAPEEVKQSKGRGGRGKRPSQERKPRAKKQQADDGFTQVEERKPAVRKQPPRDAKRPRTGPKKEEI